MRTELYPYTSVPKPSGGFSMRPLLPITLSIAGQSAEAVGLLDTGADISVMPYSLGLALGADWVEQQVAIQLGGNLANYEARILLVNAAVGSLKPVRLVFAWTKAENVPLILGQVDFFREFNVCFFGSQQTFEVSAKS